VYLPGSSGDFFPKRKTRNLECETRNLERRRKNNIAEKSRQLFNYGTILLLEN